MCDQADGPCKQIRVGFYMSSCATDALLFEQTYLQHPSFTETFRVAIGLLRDVNDAYRQGKRVMVVTGSGPDATFQQLTPSGTPLTLTPHGEDPTDA